MFLKKYLKIEGGFLKVLEIEGVLEKYLENEVFLKVLENRGYS